jgi:hypothetical protein
MKIKESLRRKTEKRKLLKFALPGDEIKGFRFQADDRR